MNSSYPHILDALSDEEQRRLVIGVRPITTIETVALIEGHRRTLPHSQAETLWALIAYGTPAHGFLLCLRQSAYEALAAAEALALELGCSVEDLTGDDGLPRPPG
jgi:hypothetical protein